MTQVKGNTALKAAEVTKPVLMISEGGKNKTTANEVKKEVEVKPETVVKKEPTLQELKNRATVLFLLQEKHTKLSDKRASLDNFAIKHEESNATITVRDANGEEFKSSSPKTIGRFIEFCKEEFEVVINEVESELKKTFAA